MRSVNIKRKLLYICSFVDHKTTFDWGFIPNSWITAVALGWEKCNRQKFESKGIPVILHLGIINICCNVVFWAYVLLRIWLLKAPFWVAWMVQKSHYSVPNKGTKGLFPNWADNLDLNYRFRTKAPNGCQQLMGLGVYAYLKTHSGSQPEPTRARFHVVSLAIHLHFMRLLWKCPM
ncbi:hypothetical protein HanRHA438_Chr05g0234781 [Helianthus annuus]|nr:hypothetical protein HanRHA438_Chr05g0234781 [Helianthus annuus]